MSTCLQTRKAIYQVCAFVCVCVRVLANVFIILCMSVRVCVFDINVCFCFVFRKSALEATFAAADLPMASFPTAHSDIITLVDSRRVPWSMVYDCSRPSYQHVKCALHFSNTRSDKVPQDNRDLCGLITRPP